MTTDIPEANPVLPPAANYLPPEPVYELQRQLAVQTRRIAELEARLPQTNLVSPNFLTRSFAVWGHYFVSNLILGTIFTCLVTVALIAISLIAGVSVYELFNYQINP